MGITPLERLRGIAAAGRSPAPVHRDFGTLVDHVEAGHVRAHLPALPVPELRGVGPIPVLADLVLSGAVSTNLSAGGFVTTLTLHVATVGPLPPAGAPLHASGRLTAVGPDSGVSTADIDDGAGRAVAVLTSRCAVVREPSGNGRATYERRAVPAPFAALALTGAGDELRATAAPALANSGGAVQGGVLAAVAAHALDAAIGAARPALAGALCDLDVTFLRGIPADGAEFTVRTEVLRAGSRFASARAELRDGAGRLAVVASAAQWRDGADRVVTVQTS